MVVSKALFHSVYIIMYLKGILIEYYCQRGTWKKLGTKLRLQMRDYDMQQIKEFRTHVTKSGREVWCL